MESYSSGENYDRLGKALIAADAFEKFEAAAEEVEVRGGNASAVRIAHSEFCKRLSAADSLKRIQAVEDIIKSDETIRSYVKFVRSNKGAQRADKLDAKLGILERQNEKQIEIIIEAKEKAERDAEDLRKELAVVKQELLESNKKGEENFWKGVKLTIGTAVFGAVVTAVFTFIPMAIRKRVPEKPVSTAYNTSIVIQNLRLEDHCPYAPHTIKYNKEPAMRTRRKKVALKPQAQTL